MHKIIIRYFKSIFGWLYISSLTWFLFSIWIKPCWAVKFNVRMLPPVWTWLRWWVICWTWWMLFYIKWSDYFSVADCSYRASFQVLNWINIVITWSWNAAFSRSVSLCHVELWSICYWSLYLVRWWTRSYWRLMNWCINQKALSLTNSSHWWLFVHGVGWVSIWWEWCFVGWFLFFDHEFICSIHVC